MPSLLLAIILIIPTLGQAFGPHPSAVRRPVLMNEPAEQSWSASKLGSLPLSFERNQGQTNASIDFCAHGPGYGIYLTSSSLIISMVDAVKPDGAHKAERIQIGLKGAKAETKGQGLDERPGKTHYFIGSDAKNWLTEIPSFGKVRYEDIYPGIDAVYYGNPQHLEYDFLVSPGADPHQICFKIEGGSSAVITPAGDLAISLPNGAQVTLPKPEAFQQVRGKRSEVSAWFEPAARDEYRVRVGEYLKDKELIIDPYVVYSNVLKGSFSFGQAIAVDSAGFIYVTGYADALPEAFTLGPMANFGIFVTKLDPTGTSLVYSAFIGGHGQDDVSSIQVDGQGCAYVAGSTYSSDFPVTQTALQTTHGGSLDGFVLKLAPAGNAILWGTFLGGAYGDSISRLSLDAAGHVLVTGGTQSSDFPVVNSAPTVFRRGLVRSTDGGATWDLKKKEPATALVSDLASHPAIPGVVYAATETGLLRSTDDGMNWSRVEGPGITAFKKVSIGPNGQVYAYGYNGSLWRSSPSGDSWANVVIPTEYRVNDLAFDPVSPNTVYAAGGAGLWRTTDGGQTWIDVGMRSSIHYEAYSVAVNPANPQDIYVSDASGFFLRSQNGGQSWSSLVAGSAAYRASEILIDPTTPSTMYAVNGYGGLGKSTDSGTTWTSLGVPAKWLEMSPADPRTLYTGGFGNSGLKRSTDGGATWTTIAWPGFLVKIARVSAKSGYLNAALDHHADAFLSVLQADGHSLLYSSTFGGPGVDYATGIRTDASGSCYLGGSASSDFPFTVGGQPANAARDAFVLKLSPTFDAIWATRIGGSNNEYANDLALSPDGSIVLVGQTYSSDFPTTATALGPVDTRNAMAVKVDNQNGTIQSSVVFGGARDDSANAVAVDHLGRVHVTGSSTESTFPVTDTAWTESGYALSNVFYAILGPRLDSIEYSVLFPSGQEAEGRGLALGSDESAFLTGQMIGYPTPGFGLAPSCDLLGAQPTVPWTSSALIVKIAAGAGSPPSVYPTDLTLARPYGTAIIRVNVPGHAEWLASTADSWLTVSPGAGCGPGFVSVRYLANETGTLRRGEISIGQLKVKVTQPPSPPSDRKNRGPRSGPLGR